VIANVGLVGVNGVLVGLDRVEVPADPDVDVTGHVHDVPGARHECRQPLGGRESPLRLHRFHGVDVEMIRARMIWIVQPQPLIEVPLCERRRVVIA
jgi:hypothetical protein